MASYSSSTPQFKRGIESIPVGVARSRLFNIDNGAGTTLNSVLIRPLPYPGDGLLVALNEQRLLEDRAIAKVAPARLEDW